MPYLPGSATPTADVANPSSTVTTCARADAATNTRSVSVFSSGNASLAFPPYTPDDD